MSYAAWQGKWPVADGERADSYDDFTLREVDTDGLSLFAVDTENERLLVVAAIACERKKVGNVDLLEISDEHIMDLGEAVPTPGTFALMPVNALHRSFAWEQARLNQLVDRLLELRCKAVRYKKVEVTAALTQIELEDVESGPHRDWLVSIKTTTSPK